MNMPNGKAWRFDLDAIRMRMKADPASDAAVDAWLIEAPWAHPVWHSYLVMLIHLRPIPGYRTADHLQSARDARSAGLRA